MAYRGKYLFSALLLAGISYNAIGVATAADIDPTTPEIPAKPSWSNIYIGGFFGAGGITNNIEIPALGTGNFNGFGGEGIQGGGRLGFNHQFSDFVFGLEGEVAGSGIETTLDIPGLISVDAGTTLTLSASARAGYLTNPDTLAYLIGGFTHADFDVDIPGLLSLSEDLNGFHIGAGIETRLNNALTARAEYRYTQYSGVDFDTGGILNVEPSTHTGSLGLSWQFYDAATGQFQSPFGDDDSTGSSNSRDWSSFFAGVYFGGGSVAYDTSLPAVAPGNFNGTSGEGFLGGGLAGYNHQLSQRFVAGIQGEVGYEGLEINTNIPAIPALGGLAGAAAGLSFDADAGLDFAAAVSLRLGALANDDALVYLIGGYSYAQFEITASSLLLPGGSFSLSENFSGFHIGTGVETRVTDNVNLRAEYRYTQYSGEDFGLGAILDIEPSSHTGRIAVTWQF